ncbi:MAG: SMC-Scp complex subunit ScpB, partial [Hyphococcus sp.]
TTDDFLQQFGLETIQDLPGLADLKAAGLLDARLPPGFAVPTPGDDEIDDEADDEGEDAEFAQDFMAADEADATDA